MLRLGPSRTLLEPSRYKALSPVKGVIDMSNMTRFQRLALGVFVLVQAVLVSALIWDLGGRYNLDVSGSPWSADDMAARWASWAVLFGAIQLLVSVAGVAYVAMTLAESRRAMSLQHDLARQANRAYVHAELAELEWGSQSYWLQFTFTNSGQTPAKHFEFGAVWSEVPRGEARSMPFLDLDELKRWSAIGGGGDSKTARWYSDDPSFSESVARRYQAGKVPETVILVMGVVRYLTIYNETFETEFAFFIDLVAKHELVNGVPVSRNRQKLSRSTNPARTFELC